MLVGVGGQTSTGQGVTVGVVLGVGVQNSGGQNVGLGVGVLTTPTVIEMLSTQTSAGRLGPGVLALRSGSSTNSRTHGSSSAR